VKENQKVRKAGRKMSPSSIAWRSFHECVDIAAEALGRITNVSEGREPLKAAFASGFSDELEQNDRWHAVCKHTFGMFT
jgi:hypothetical protein